MEAAYRQAVAGKRRAKQTEAMGKGEKRRLIQLIVSLCLFLVVFWGRDAFLLQLEAWNSMMSEDTDFRTLFSRVADAFAEGDGLHGLLGTNSGKENPIPSEMPAAQPTISESQIVTLGQTSRHGLQYIRETSFLRALPLEMPDVAVERTEPEEKAPEVVTAVAQTYGPGGDELPGKVSFQFYELGIEKTVTPVMGTVTSEFGYRNGPISGEREFHLALDIAADKGTDILAFADGVVRYIGESDTFGLYLMIDHDNGVSTFYAHCSKLLVRKGDTITCGQTVAKVGSTGNSTGPHLHFTLSKDGIRLDPSYYVAPSTGK